MTGANHGWGLASENATERFKWLFFGVGAGNMTGRKREIMKKKWLDIIISNDNIQPTQYPTLEGEKENKKKKKKEQPYSLPSSPHAYSRRTSTRAVETRQRELLESRHTSS